MTDFVLSDMGNDRVALKTVHGTYVTALDDRRLLGHTRQLESFELNTVRLPARPLHAFNVELVVTAKWASSFVGAWCIEWKPLSQVRPAGAEAILRLCFNSSSRTQYWQQRGELSSGNERHTRGARVWGRRRRAATTETGWAQIGEEHRLEIHPGEQFELGVAVDKMVASYSIGSGPWRSSPTGVTLLELQRSMPSVCAYGALLKRLQISLQNLRGLELLPPFLLTSAKKAAVRGAPAAFEQAKGQPGPAKFRFFNPSTAWWRKGKLHVLGLCANQVAALSFLLLMLGRISHKTVENFHLLRFASSAACTSRAAL